MSAIKLRCPDCGSIIAFARHERIRPARGVALAKLPNGKVRLMCRGCRSFRDLDGLTIVLLRIAAEPATVRAN